MCRYKMGNPKKSSRFICLRCLNVNQLGEGIQRGGKQREKNHIKDLACMCTGFNEITKNLEVRYCDNMKEMMDRAEKLHDEYYGGCNEEIS